MSERRIIEINGVKLDVDMRTARRIEELRIGDRVKVLKPQPYNEQKFDVLPGVVVGFEPFKNLPTIVIATIKVEYSSVKVEFIFFNAESKVELIHAADADFTVDKPAILAAFDRERQKHQAEIDKLEEQRRYFETNFRAFWQSAQPPPAE